MSFLPADLAESYRRQILAEITAPSFLDVPGSKVFDRTRGYWRYRTNPAWPEFELFDGWFALRAQWERVTGAWAEFRLRLSEAVDVLRHGLPEREDW